MKYYILFGPPGAGKGTQATAMVEKYNLHHISTGALLRKEIAAGTELGLQAKALIEKGCLVPDEVVEAMIENEFKTVTEVDGFLLDGFPRTTAQAEALEAAGVEIDKVLLLEVDDNKIVERLSSRRECSKCGIPYNIVSKRPAKEGICDSCGGELIIRKDDKPETVRHRLEVYHESTEILKGFYELTGRLRLVNGNQSIEGANEDILKAIGAQV